MRIVDASEVLTAEEETGTFAVLSRKPLSASEPLPIALPTAITARLYGFDAENRPLITDLPGLVGDVVVARSAVPLQADQRGCTLVLWFEQGDVRRPIIVGVLHDDCPAVTRLEAPPRIVSVHVDNERVLITADREIVLRCGESSITLTKAGKVLIQGAYVSSRSSGVNRIKGGSVQIN